MPIALVKTHVFPSIVSLSRFTAFFQVVLFKAMFDLIADLHLEPLGIHGCTSEGILKFYEVLILIYIANVWSS